MHVINFLFINCASVAGRDGFLFPALRQYLNVIGHFKNPRLKKVILILTILYLAIPKAHGQQVDTSYYPSGQLRDIKFYQGDKIVKATTFKESGEEKYHWDIQKKILVSFDNIGYLDTLAEYFKQHSPDYTLYQHYGNGPLKNIENYKDNARYGDYIEYSREGNIIAKGQFKNWEKTGIWTYYDDKGKADKHIHWFHHSFNEGGISINYTVMPVAVTLLLIIGSLFVFLKKATFSKYFISYSIFTAGLFVLLFILGHVFSEETLIAISTSTGKYFFPVLTTFTATMAILSLTALIFKRKTGVRPVYSILFFVVSIGLGFILLSAYIGSKMTGIVM